MLVWVSFSSMRSASGSSSWLLNFLRSCQGRSLCLGRGRAGVRGRLSVCTSIHPASCLPTSLSRCPPTRALCQEPPKPGAGDRSLPGDSPLWDPLRRPGGRLGTLLCTPPPIVPALPRGQGSQRSTPLTWMSPSPPWGCHHHKDVTATRCPTPSGIAGEVLGARRSHFSPPAPWSPHPPDPPCPTHATRGCAAPGRRGTGLVPGGGDPAGDWSLLRVPTHDRGAPLRT